MEKSFNTPILFLIFNRYDLTQKVFNLIKEIKPEHLYVAADGPRKGNKEDIINCKKTRDIIHQVDWQCDVKVLYRDKNLGCGWGVASSINWFFEQVEEGIILEDDCLPDLSFFYFCQELLIKYREDNNIYLISGTNLQNGNMRGHGSYYFSNYPLTWGWATWRRAWNKFDYHISDYDKVFKGGSIDHVFHNKTEKMFWRNKMHEAESKKKYIWDYQWFYAVWKNKGKSIAPNVNLIHNLGFNNKSTHAFLHDSLREPLIVNSMQFPLVHSVQKINHVADYFIFQNVISHSSVRILRLIKENGILSIIKYILIKFYHKPVLRMIKNYE